MLQTLQSAIFTLNLIYSLLLVLVGIDTGTDTGIGLRIGNEVSVFSLKIHKALKFIESLITEDRVHIRVEDARKRKWFGNNSKAKKQGAGSIKRDAVIWEDFLNDLKEQSNGLLTFEMIHPIKGGTKLSASQFKALTGITTRTNQHGRDAYMIIHNFKLKNF